MYCYYVYPTTLYLVCGGAVASWLVRSFTDRAVRVRALARGHCCVLRQDTNSHGAVLRREINNCDLHSPLFSVTFLSYLNAWRELLENWTPAQHGRTPSLSPRASQSLALLAFSFASVNYRD